MSLLAHDCTFFGKKINFILLGELYSFSLQGNYQWLTLYKMQNFACTKNSFLFYQYYKYFFLQGIQIVNVKFKIENDLFICIFCIFSASLTFFKGIFLIIYFSIFFTPPTQILSKLAKQNLRTCLQIFGGNSQSQVGRAV